MAKVTISIEGSSEEIAGYLQKLAGNTSQINITGIHWLPDEIEILYNSLQDSAKKIMREVANKPGGYHRDDLIKKLHLVESTIPGNLSSIEFQRKKYFPAKRKPMELNWETWEYVMLPEVAQWILDNIG